MSDPDLYSDDPWKKFAAENAERNRLEAEREAEAVNRKRIEIFETERELSRIKKDKEAQEFWDGLFKSDDKEKNSDDKKPNSHNEENSISGTIAGIIVVWLIASLIFNSGKKVDTVKKSPEVNSPVRENLVEKVDTVKKSPEVNSPVRENLVEKKAAPKTYNSIGLAFNFSGKFFVVEHPGYRYAGDLAYSKCLRDKEGSGSNCYRDITTRGGAPLCLSYGSVAKPNGDGFIKFTLVTYNKPQVNPAFQICLDRISHRNIDKKHCNLNNFAMACNF